MIVIIKKLIKEIWMKKIRVCGLIISCFVLNMLSMEENITQKIVGVSFSYLCDQNKKHYNEDIVLFDYIAKKGLNIFGVADGHNGDEAVKNLEFNFYQVLPLLLEKKDLSLEQVLKNAYKTIDEKIRKDCKKSGSTLVTLCIDAEKKIVHVVNTGDSRALITNGFCGADSGIQCFSTKDHKANDPEEEKRIKENGGYLEYYNHGYRVNGLLISRTLGDDDLKYGNYAKQIIAEPDYNQLILTPKNNFMVIASDGLWDRMTNEEAEQMVHDGLKNGKTLDAIVEELKNAVIKKGSKDNISIIVIRLDWGNSENIKYGSAVKIGKKNT